MGRRVRRSNIGRIQASAATLAVFLLAALLPAVGAAQSSQPLPAVNLGFTSFLDGGPPAGPGFYFQTYLQYLYADEFKDKDGDDAKLLDDLHALVSLNQGIYQSDQSVPLIGGKWGIDVILPLVFLDVDPTPLPPPFLPLNDYGVGLGDLLVGPYIQWGPIMGDKGPVFMHRIELQNLVPIGAYDDDKVLNPGANFYSFNPYWSATWFIMPRWKLSWRFHYLWNAKNYDPIKRIIPPGTNNTQAGQAIHFNFASSFEAMPKQLHVGINGYYLKQITDTKVDGKGISGTREQVLGIGPGAVWHFSQNDHLFANFYFETEAENRPEGRIRLNLRWTHHF